jgi:hypothetical protein
LINGTGNKHPAQRFSFLNKDDLSFPSNLPKVNFRRKDYDMNTASTNAPVNEIREPIALGSFSLINAVAMLFISVGLCFFGMQPQWHVSWKVVMSMIAFLSVVLGTIFAINTASAYTKAIGDPDRGSKLLGYGVLFSVISTIVCGVCTGILFYRFVVDKTV